MRGRATSVWMLTTVALAIVGAFTLVERGAIAPNAPPAIASGPRMPDLTNTYLKDARARLAAEGLEGVVIERRTRTYLCATDDECPPPFEGWRVVVQQPAAGETVPADSPLVGLTVIRFTTPRTIPGYDSPQLWESCCS